MSFCEITDSRSCIQRPVAVRSDARKHQADCSGVYRALLAGNPAETSANASAIIFKESPCSSAFRIQGKLELLAMSSESLSSRQVGVLEMRNSMMLQDEEQ